MSERQAEKLKDELCYAPKNGLLRADDETLNSANAFAEGYKAFLDNAKTEREAVENVQMLAELFIIHKNYATAAALADAQQRLVDHFGYTWPEAEAIEIEAYKEA